MHTCYNIAVTRGRLIIAIITTLLDDILILVLLFIGLPYFGIHLPLALIIGIALLWIVIAVFLYLVGGKVLKKKPLVGFTDMVNSKGKVVRALAPEGMVKIKGELWSAKSEGEHINKNEEIIVTGQNNLKLTVRKYIQENQ
jgi:membrane protein implicated in regulation of membrane protease activity